VNGSRGGNYTNGVSDHLGDSVYEMRVHAHDSVKLFTNEIEMPKPNMSRRAPYAMTVEREGQYVDYVLENPRLISATKINNNMVKGEFVEFDNYTVAGDSGAPIVDSRGFLVGMVFATSLGVLCDFDDLIRHGDKIMYDRENTKRTASFK
jgi:V8-like Glu-specific endopeptidase